MTLGYAADGLWLRGWKAVALYNNNKLYLPPLAIELQWYHKPISNRQSEKVT